MTPRSAFNNLSTFIQDSIKVIEKPEYPEDFFHQINLLVAELIETRWSNFDERIGFPIRELLRTILHP